MTLNCRGNMLLSIFLTVLLWELSIGRSIGKNDNETLYDENLDYAVTTSSTVAQEWTSAFTNVPSTNDTEKGYVTDEDYHQNDLENIEDLLDLDTISSTASISHSLNESIKQENSSSTIEGIEYMAIEITTKRVTTLEDSNEDRDPLEMKSLDMSTLSDDLSDDFEFETTVENTDSPIYKKEVDHIETPVQEITKRFENTVTTMDTKSDNQNITSDENLHIFPKVFGISFVTGAIILSIIALILVIKQFCCKKVTKNYAYRKLS